MYRYFTIIGLVIGFLVIPVPAVKAATGAFEHVRGRILIDVDMHGEAWYVHPISGKRYDLNTPTNVLAVMRELGLGITDQNLAKIPQENDNFSLATGLRPVAGRILIQVENRGTAWYVHPETLKRYRLGSPVEALHVMASLGLGITHKNLLLIPHAALLSRSVYHSAPFVPQAPFAEWGDRRQREGCEEAAALMSVRWARSQSLNRYDAREQIIAASYYEEENLGFYEDTSIADTATYLLRGFFGHDQYEVRSDIDVADIAQELVRGRVVLVGVEGRALGNPNFPGRSQFRHMLLVIGYDSDTDEFITHDPGTRNGGNYRYASEVLQGALLDYPSGYREPVNPTKTGLIAVYR